VHIIWDSLPQIEGKEAEIRKAYAKKVRKEELPSDVLNTDLLAAEKRKALISFAYQTREQCLRSLAAVKFAQHADKIRQAEVKYHVEIGRIRMSEDSVTYEIRIIYFHILTFES